MKNLLLLTLLVFMAYKKAKKDDLKPLPFDTK